MSDQKRLFFVRQGISIPLRLLGKKIEFQDFGADVGGLTFIESPAVAQYVTAIRGAIQQQIGGMTEVDEAGFLAAKKAASDAQTNRELRAAQSSLGSPFNPNPRLAAGVDPMGNAPAERQVVVEMPAAPDLAPVAEVDPSRVYLTSQSYPKPITNNDYKKLYAPPAAEPEKKAARPPSVAKISTLKK